jgi:hypothetical protein
MRVDLTHHQRNWILITLGMEFFFVFLTLLLRAWLAPDLHEVWLRQVHAGFEQQFNPYGEAIKKIAARNTHLVFELEKIERCTHDALFDQLSEVHPAITSRDVALADRTYMIGRVRYNLKIGGDTYYKTGERLAA